MNLRRQIHGGELKPGDRLPSHGEMKALYGLSRPTVERVHALLEQDGLIVRESRRGTFVASTKKRAATNLIGICGFGFQEEPRLPYWTYLQSGIQEAAINEGKNVILLSCDTVAGWDKVDGLLVGDEKIDPILSMLKPVFTDLPIVSLLYPIEGVSCVLANDYQGGQLATQHLLKLGHRKIACLMDEHHSFVRSRVSGYRDALISAGITPDSSWIRPYSTPEVKSPDFSRRGEEVMCEWLADNWERSGCTALIGMNDMVALGAMKALQDAGYRIPQDVSIIGFDNIEVCNFTTPTLSSIGTSLHGVGKVATDILLQQITTDQKTAATTTMLPMEFVARQSTGLARQKPAR